MKQIIVYDLTKAEDINDYYRSFLSGNPDKDQPILGIMRQRSNNRNVQMLVEGMMEAVRAGVK